MTREVAVAVTLQGLAAPYLVHDVHPVGPRTTVLVHAGAGGTGRLVVQWLHALGATVFATVGTAEKANVAAEAGGGPPDEVTANDLAPPAPAPSDQTGGGRP